MKIPMNKLVRDGIPRIILDSGSRPEYTRLDAAEIERALTEKLTEEAGEFALSHEIEELADVMEVVYALAERKGVSREKLEQVRTEKAKARGGFEDGIFLRFVERPD